MMINYKSLGELKVDGNFLTTWGFCRKNTEQRHSKWENATRVYPPQLNVAGRPALSTSVQVLLEGRAGAVRKIDRNH